MQVVGMIDQFNIERPNSVEDDLKMEMLRKCEANLIDSVVLHYEPKEDEKTYEEWLEHLDTFNYDTELLLKEPFDDLYIFYLDQRIALNNNDTKRYNVSSRLYDNLLLGFKQKYNREHKPLHARKMLLSHEVL